MKIDTPTFESGSCRGCGKDIYLIRTKRGNLMHISRMGNNELVPHFFDCPEANKFRKEK